MTKRLFTSEAVSMGHPDKLADQISDAVLDALFTQDPYSRVACETLVTTGVAIIAGEITTKAQIDYQEVVRKAIENAGYVDDEWGINAKTAAVLVSLDRQSPDIAQGVNEHKEVEYLSDGSGKTMVKVSESQSAHEVGAGDQGLMFGYAINHTPELTPLPISLSHKITNRLTEARINKEVTWLRPDSKSQVTVEFDGTTPVRIDTIVVSTQHDPSIDQKGIADYVIPNIVEPLLPKELLKGDVKYFINPTGKFVVGGPHGDCGLTGRKIIVDTYGGWARHGGGAFSGKDPTKVDRSAAYMARHVAKNVVAAGIADRCEVQLAYAIGIAEPVSVLIDTDGTSKIDEEKLGALIREFFPLSPSGIIKYLDLRRPIYQKTAYGGHFGRNDPDFTWENTARADELKKAAGLS
ncbi:MAG: methionine adenosyltransferase [Planctomycetaceae bacterium]|nr:methionine adenosyltransferase [Planctomycetaceae bacterium]